jgi:hypothetical protein
MSDKGDLSGHDMLCHYCMEACDALAGNPGRWPVGLCHKDAPGVVKWHHVECVASRLQRLQDIERELAALKKLAWQRSQGWETLAELAEAKVDAERYRWMRLCAGNPDEMAKLEAFDDPKNPEEFDASIDASRKP